MFLKALYEKIRLKGERDREVKANDRNRKELKEGSKVKTTPGLLVDVKFLD